MHRVEASKGEVATYYFKSLFTSSSLSITQEIFRDFVPRIQTSLNEHLIGKVSKEEIKATVFSIKPQSVPGEDGMTGVFFQQYWDVVGDLVTQEVMRFFEVGSF